MNQDYEKMLANALSYEEATDNIRESIIPTETNTNENYIYETPNTNIQEPIIENPSYYEQVQEPTISYEIPTKQDGYTYDYSNTENVSTNNIKQIIEITDTFRNYTSFIKESISSYLGLGKNDEDYKVVERILSFDKNNSIILDKLLELKSLDRVNRAFTLFSLDENLLNNLKSTLENFNKSNFNDGFDKIKLAKFIEKEIERLDSKTLDIVKPLNDLLNLK